MTNSHDSETVMREIRDSLRELVCLYAEARVREEETARELKELSVDNQTNRTDMDQFFQQQQEVARASAKRVAIIQYLLIAALSLVIAALGIGIIVLPGF